MMILNTMLMVASPLLAPAPMPVTPDILAIKVGTAETVSDGTIRHAVILVEDGKIVVVGEDLPIERGIPVIDLGPDSVAIPGLVNVYSRVGLDSRGGNDSQPQLLASKELYPDPTDFEEILESGITTMALYPAGNGIPGQAVAVRPYGDTKEDMIVRDNVYLKVIMRSNSSSRKMITDGFEKADEYIEKEKKAREKWDKAKEKADKAKKKKKDDKDDKDAKPEPELAPYAAPEMDEEAAAFQQLRDGELRALISISNAADYLHLLDAIGEEEFGWDLRIPVSRSLNMFYVKSELGELGCRVVMEPLISVHPNTRRQRNMPMELSEAGAKLVLVPRTDSSSNQKAWLRHTGELVAAGLPREAALRAMTLEPAELLGLGDRLGSLAAGMDANILFFKADPFEPGSKIEAVMLEGDIVVGEIN